MARPITSNLENRTLDPAVGEQFRVAFGLDAAPTTLADWVGRSSRLLRAGFRTEEPTSTEVVVYDLKTAGHSHRARGLFEALVLPFVWNEETQFLVRSRSPHAGTPVEIRVHSGNMCVTPKTAVTSFGVAGDVVDPEYFDVTPEIAFYRFNQYTNVFPTEKAYEGWGSDTSDIVTTSLPVPDAIGLARSITEEWDGQDGEPPEQYCR